MRTEYDDLLDKYSHLDSMIERARRACYEGRREEAIRLSCGILAEVKLLDRILDATFRPDEIQKYG